MNHYQNFNTQINRIDQELIELEIQAGVRNKIEAFVEYNTNYDRRKVYFDANDKSLRKKLIAKFRERQEYVSNHLTQAQIADAKVELEVVRRSGAILPWKIPGLAACIAVWVGYHFWTMPGALAGAVVGLFIGQAEVSRHKFNQAEEVKSAEQNLSELEDELRKDLREKQALEGTTLGMNPFSETEEESGCEDEGGDRPIHWAARNGSVEEVKELLASGAKIDERNGDNYGSQPLHRAAACGNDDVVKFLISAGASVHTPNTMHGWLPIHFAAAHKNAESIHALIAAGSNVNREDRYGLLPIHRAAEGGNPEIIKALIAAGAKADARANDNGMQPIHYASLSGHAEAVSVLLAAGANVNAVNNAGILPIQHASNNKNAEVIKVLIAAGAKQPSPA